MILVVGDVMTDVIVRAETPFAHGTDTPASIVARPGGSGANLACWIGHLDGSVAFAGRVGHSDAAAQQAALRAHGVAASLAIDGARETGRTVAIVEAGGERSFYTDHGANHGLGADDLPPGLLDGCALLHVSGHTLALPAPRAAALGLMRAARARGCPVSVDAGSEAYLRDGGAAAFAASAAEADLLFANAAEAALLLPPAPETTLIVTDGARGARAWRGGEVASAPARAVSLVDGIGAGDAFMAGFLRAWVGVPDLAASLRAGVDAAAGALRQAGGRPPAPADGGNSRAADVWGARSARGSACA